MRLSTRSAAVVAAASALLVGSAAAAAAQSTTIDDRRYDVLLDDDTLASKGTYAQRVAAARIDVDKMTVNHGTSFISFRVSLHRLDPSGYGYANVKTNSGTADDFRIFVYPGSDGSIEATTEPAADDESGTATWCSTSGGVATLTGSSKTGTNGFIQLYIPRACFENPTSVRVGGTAVYDAGDDRFNDPVNSRYAGTAQYTKTLARN